MVNGGLPDRAGLELACDKWMPIILRDIGLLERRTFNQLLSTTWRVSPRALSQQN